MALIEDEIVIAPAELMLRVRSYEPDIAITDIRMPPTHSDEGIRAAASSRSSA